MNVEEPLRTLGAIRSSLACPSGRRSVGLAVKVKKDTQVDSSHARLIHIIMDTEGALGRQGAKQEVVRATTGQ